MTIPYTLTISPNDKLQHFNSINRLRKVTDDVRTLLYNTLGSTLRYELYTEVSYPTEIQNNRGGRIHYHGIIYLTPVQKAKMYVEYLPKLTNECRIELDTIQDLAIWQSYIIKDKEAMFAYCKEEHVPYKLDNHMAKPTLQKEKVNKGVYDYLNLKQPMDTEKHSINSAQEQP